MLSLAQRKVIAVEKKYWIGRKHAAMAMARGAAGSEARLIHYELAGRYSVKAAQCLPFLAPRKAPSAGAEPVALRLSEATSGSSDAAYYGRLRIGAEYLAARASDPEERDRHLEMARTYGARALEAAVPAVSVH